MDGIVGTGAARIAGIVIGLALVAGFALQWRVAPSARPLGLALELEAAPSGELAVEADGPVLRSPMLLDGPEHEIRGEMRVTNQTGGRLAAWPRLADAPQALDRLMQIRIDHGGRPVFRGPAADLRRAGAGRPVVLPRGGSATLAVTAWLPDGSGRETMGRRADWRLSFEGRGR